MTKVRENLTFPWLKKYPNDIAWGKEILPQALFTILDQSVKQFPHRPCINFLGKKYTYQEIDNLVKRVAQGLQNRGVQKDTRVGLFMPNTPYYVIFYYAVLKAGDIVVNFNPLYAPSEIHHQIEDAGCEIIVTLDLDFLFKKIYGHLETSVLQKIIICPLKTILPFPKNLLFPLFKAKKIALIPKDDRIILYQDLLQNEGNPELPFINPLEDIAIIQYTGGTMGVPKGAMLTHSNVYCNALQYESWFRPLLEPGHEKTLAVLPFFHVFAMTVVMNMTLRVGGEIIMMFPRFELDEAMKLVQKHQITCLPAVPTIYTLINNHPKRQRFNLKSLKACISGGAPLPVEVKKEFEKLTGAKLIEGYGLSEASPVVSANPLIGENKGGSIGLPLPQSHIKIMSLENPELEMPLGEKGQIAVSGPQVMKGYWKKQAHDMEEVLKNGFLYTGDIGYMDEEGYTFLIDRLKDIIIMNGYNVYPRIVEEAIYQHSAVEEVTVVGVPDPIRGESVKAFIKIRKNMTLEKQEMLNFLRSRLSPLEVPKEIEFRDTLPKTMIGKLSKKELRASESESLKV